MLSPIDVLLSKHRFLKVNKIKNLVVFLMFFTIFLKKTVKNGCIKKNSAYNTLSLEGDMLKNILNLQLKKQK